MDTKSFMKLKSNTDMIKQPFLLGHLQLRAITFFCLLLCSAAFSKPVINKYNLKFSFDFSERKLFCKAELSLNNVKQNDTLNLLLYRLLKVKSIKDTLGNDITFDQHVTSFSDWEALQVNSISVFLGESKPYNTDKTIIIEYDG